MEPKVDFDSSLCVVKYDFATVFCLCFHAIAYTSVKKF